MERIESVWRSMIARCENTNASNYENYGGRGIRVCEEWHNFEAFKEWALNAGYDKDAPRGVCTIDRIDNDGNYEPANCRWTNAKEQARNRRTTKYIEIEGVSKPLAAWAEEYGIPYQIINNRYYVRKMRGKDLLKPCKVIVGKNVKKLRELRGETDKIHLAFYSGVSYSTLDEIEKGRHFPQGITSRRLAKYFNLPVETFTCVFEEG